ncbi:MAG: cysteine desulfurase [Planctomycetaceae bacterium]|nr:MAG: cysteine desulfurase [Planctomycetaceae bacterium]
MIETVSQHLGESFGNPGSRHAAGRRARVVLEDSRETIARILGADPGEVIFTSGGTESTNLALFGLAAGEPGLVLTTAGEHPATTESITALAERGWSSRPLQVDPDGRLLPDELTALPWDDIRLATVILAHNETGVVQDLDPLSKACHEHKVPWHVDAVQAVGKIPVDFHRLGATSLALGAHKFHGPRGIGALLLRDGCRLAPFEFGGHQEAGRRPGTEVVALAAGMARALESWDSDRTARTDRIQAFRDRLRARTRKARRPHRGQRAPRSPPAQYAEHRFSGSRWRSHSRCPRSRTCRLLARQHLQQRFAEPAPALVAMGRSEEVYRASVRFSVGLENTVEEIDEAVRRVSGVVARLRESAPVA